MTNVCEKISPRPTGFFTSLVGLTQLAPVFLLPFPNFFSELAFPHSLQLSRNFSYQSQNLQFIPQQIPTSPHPHVLQLGRCICAKRELRYSQYLAQVHRIATLIVHQNLYRLESLLVLKQPSCNVFRLESNVGGFFKHQNVDADRNKRCFFTAHVSQVNVNTMRKNFEEWSELQVAEHLTVNVRSISYNVSNSELWNEWKPTQEGSFCVTNDIALNQVRVYIERVYQDNVVGKFWFVRSVSSQHHSNYLANVPTEIVSRVGIKKCNTRFFICKVHLIFFALFETY